MCNVTFKGEYPLDNHCLVDWQIRQTCWYFVQVREVQESLDAHTEETAELSEAAEMAALDKEMAEER